MNDNWATGWRGASIGIAFRTLGLLLLIGSLAGGIYYPHNAWAIPAIIGFAMVMV